MKTSDNEAIKLSDVSKDRLPRMWITGEISPDPNHTRSSYMGACSNWL
jgi:hypothetical protein